MTAAALLGLAAAGAFSLVGPKSYVAVARLEATLRRGGEGPEAVATIRDRILAPERIESVARGGGSGATAHEPREPESVIAATAVEADGETQPGDVTSLLVSHAAPDPDTAVRTVEALVSEFRTELYDEPRRLQERVVADARKAFEAAEAAAVAAEAARAEHHEANRDLLDPLDEQVAALRREIEEVEKGEAVRLEDKAREADQVLSVEPQYRREEIREVDRAALAEVENEMLRHQALIKDLTENKNFNDSHLEVREAKEALSRLEVRKKEIESKETVRAAMSENPVWAEYAKQRDEAASALLVARKRIESLRKNEKHLQELARQAPPVREQAERLAAAAAAARATAESLRQALTAAETRLTGIQDERPFDVHVVAAPERPRTPSGPGPALLALAGTVGGALVGLAAAWVVTARDPTFLTAAAVAPSLGVPELGAISFFETETEAAASRRRSHRTTAALVGLALAAAGVAGASMFSGRDPGPSDAAHAAEDATR